MAMPAQLLCIGVDTAKTRLEIAIDEQASTLTIDNTRPAIRQFLKGVPAGAALAIEATNTFHMEMVEQADAAGIAVYVVDAYQLSHYRKGVGGRAKTDRTDAQLLCRYLKAEQASLRRWVPPKGPYREIQQLLRRRAQLVRARVSLQQSLSGIPGIEGALGEVNRQIGRLEGLLEARLKALLLEHGLMPTVKRCEAIEGIGFLTAAALVMSSLRGDFASSDAFIAFIGMDVKARDSGSFSGKRKLSKQGDREVRRLLHNAAMAASRMATWKAFYQRYLSQGKSRIQALVALARKLARVAFSIIRSGEHYVATKACSA
jgi:transposase